MKLIIFPHLFSFHPCAVDEPKTAEITASTKTTDDTPIVETVKNAEVANLDAKLVEAAVKTEELKALNTNSASNDVSKTTTTVTVNVTQTKVTLGDEVDKSSGGLGEVVSTVSSIAEAAVGAIENELKKPAEAAVANSVDVDDIEMADADAVADCEMKDVSSVTVEEQPQVVTTTTTGTTVSETKSVEADSVNSSSSSSSNTVPAESTASIATNEAEQKIDDVEKNISNLFNGAGDDNVVSTNDKSSDPSKSEHLSAAQVASSQSGSDSSSLKNGTDGSTKSSETQSRHDAIKDNNDLVSILAGSDKPEENISSSSAQKSAAEDAKSIGNSLTTKSQITSNSGSKTTTTQSNVVNNSKAAPPSTQKQSEISSEKVSTATAEPVAVEAEQGLGGKASRQELISSLSSTVKESASSSTVSSGKFSYFQVFLFQMKLMKYVFFSPFC